ncbi:helix-turn-helix transcriptional regulator [Lampropedia aestuarii]|uniref:Helix-turn-helix transcriptional regulator n=1 Tax=Lampropedia aestuarii TaxID=2562762 RepID=A0A4S5BJW4_9BURK|nr:helix-turn-helix transcriptional regulator [Lampropedia aestuarii]THJ32774.1 helix-turn-helix transcriptional regulator [Lampropedia aestuarii]
MAHQDALKSAPYDHSPRALVVMESAWPSGASTGWHQHGKGQLLYATSGVMLVHSDIGSWVVPPNRALWLLAGMRHNVVMSGQVLMRTAYIDVQKIPQLPANSCVINVSPLLRELLVAASCISLTQVLDERHTRLLALLVDELRVSSTMALHLPMPSDARLARICQALMASPADSSSAAEWAAQIGVAERTLHRLFAKELGMGFAQWREQARLVHALQKMAKGQKLISVAMDCGYASPSAFSAMFKRHFGLPPSDFYQ